MTPSEFTDRIKALPEYSIEYNATAVMRDLVALFDEAGFESTVEVWGAAIRYHHTRSVERRHILQGSLRSKAA